MDNVVNEILEIDRKAREKIEEAYKQKDCILLETGEEEQKIKDEYIRRADNRVCKVEMYEMENANKKIEVIQQKKEATIAALKEQYEVNHSKWENDIFNNIIGG